MTSLVGWLVFVLIGTALVVAKVRGVSFKAAAGTVLDALKRAMAIVVAFVSGGDENGR